MNKMINDVLKAKNNNVLEKFQGTTAFLNINNKTFSGSDPYLMIKKESGKGYFVNGIIGFGGMGFRGHLSTQKILKILKHQGFDITAKQLNNWIRA